MAERDIKTISFGKAARTKRGMYLSADDAEALQLGLREIYVNSLDALSETNASRGTVKVTIDTPKRLITVEDDGPGIPNKIRKEDNLWSCVAAYTLPHTGSHNDGRNVNSIGVNGVGGSVVTHTAQYLNLISDDSKKRIQVHFESSENGAEVKDLQELKSIKHGVKIEYSPDSLIYNDAWFDEKTLVDEITEMMKFYPKYKVELNFDNKSYSISFPNGLKEEDTQIYYESDNLILALKLKEDGEIKPFGNRLYLPAGGNFFSHFKSQLTRLVNDLSGLKLTGTQVQKCFSGYVAIFVSNPLFSNQSKTAISNKEVNLEITNALKEHITKFSRTAAWEKVIKSLEAEMKAEEAAERARARFLATKEKIKKGKIDLDKYSPCHSKNREECELFLCEGDSAATGLIVGRNPKMQAILALRGKILNAARCDYEKLLQNNEIQLIIKAIGLTVTDTGIRVPAKLNFGKIIIAVDSDSDGIGHIASLILTFFYKYCPELFKRNLIYIAEPYLFKITWGRDNYKFLKDEAELNKFKKTITGKFVITRMKGLGEADPAELREMLLQPDRTIRLITLSMASLAEKYFALMENDPEGRKDFYAEWEEDLV